MNQTKFMVDDSFRLKVEWTKRFLRGPLRLSSAQAATQRDQASSRAPAAGRPAFPRCFPAVLPYTGRTMSFYDKLKFTADGLIPAIIQEAGTGRVLMMAWMNRASLEKTLETGKTHFWSRSRQKFWMKGESSGHVQRVKDIAFDCDGDTLLIQVEQTGAACHEGFKSCFFRSVSDAAGNFRETEPRLVNPEDAYARK
jgi:phosphoribosyl-AMP cyclohydrolase